MLLRLAAAGVVARRLARGGRHIHQYAHAARTGLPDGAKAPVEQLARLLAGVG